MPTPAQQLQSIQSFADLVRYLENELDWPLHEYGFEELTFEYQPAELGLKEADAAKVKSIHQLRPLQHGQPWGIFFVEFERKQLPVVVLRRILSHLVVKKRAAANRADAAAWDVADLLFIAAYGDDGPARSAAAPREIAFAHFHQAAGDLPTLRVLGWDGADTPLKLDYVAGLLHERLQWPDDPQDHAAWRSQWASAFRHRPNHVITTADALAAALAHLARKIRLAALTLLDHESEDGALRGLHKAFQTALIHDLSAADFADTYAQTITYGLLTAAISRTDRSGGRGDTTLYTSMLADVVPITNPFLREMLQTFLQAGGQQRGINFDELGVQDVVELLRGDATDLPAILRDFGNKTQGEDPVIHFYEHFLTAYDKALKVKRGVFYTPQPVVSYIVRSVDELLRREFGLEEGLASTVTWGELAQRMPGLKIPAGTAADSPFVVVLDPATGTATFLVEVIDVIHRTLSEQWRKQGLSAAQRQAAWNDYVPRHLLPRLYGYELMMAPYAIAHMKIGLKLHETGYRFGSAERVRVYLTNALDLADDQQIALETVMPALAHEAQAVNSIKRNHRFTVLIGNPPYSNYSANLSSSARSLVDKYRNFRGNRIRERNQLQFERNLQDDFVKFISIGETAIQASKIGVMGYITNQSMLASPSLRGMREHLFATFSRLFELNLHGGVNEIIVGNSDDQNVFDIAQAVGIHLYVSVPSEDSHTLYYSEMIGKRINKYNDLRSLQVSTTLWQRIIPNMESCSFLPPDETDQNNTKRMNNVFVQVGAGIKTNRDAIAIGFDRESLILQVQSFYPHLIGGAVPSAPIQRVLYRPFDMRYIFYHEDVVASRSLPTMQHVCSGDNIGIIASSTWTTPDRFSVNVSRTMIEMKTGTHDRGTTFFPLYRYGQLFGSVSGKSHNLTASFVAGWSRVTSTRFLSEGSGDLDSTSGPEDVFFYIYGLFHSPQYRNRFKSSLAQGFPLVILTSSRQLLRSLIQIGRQLATLHLVEFALDDEPGAPAAWPVYPRLARFRGGDRTVDKFPGPDKAWAAGRVAINASGGFDGVPETVWNFHIGGYQVCHKWLKDRKGRALSDEDVLHYAKIVTALHETIRIMGEIDAVIEAYGGWPGAFA